MSYTVSSSFPHAQYMFLYQSISNLIIQFSNPIQLWHINQLPIIYSLTLQKISLLSIIYRGQLQILTQVIRNFCKENRKKLKNGLGRFVKFYVYFQYQYNNKEIISSNNQDYKMSRKTPSDESNLRHLNSIMRNSDIGNTLNSRSMNKKPLNNYVVKPEQLCALKERVKQRNQNKENNPLFRSQNVWVFNTPENQSLPTNYKNTNDFHPELRNYSMKDFQIGDLLGRGAQAKVRFAIHKQTGSIYSIKTLSRQNIQKKLDAFIRSLKIQMFFDHPNIAKIYGLIIDNKQVHLIMQYCSDGDLSMNTYQFGKQNNKIKTILYRMAQALFHLHSNRIQHRDLKLQNVLLNYGVPKITDFQLSVYNRLEFFPRKTICGSPAYFSPQMIQKQRYNKKADIWCFGIIFYEMLCGYFPFQIKNIEDLSNITSKQIKPFPKTISNFAIDLITKMLNKESENRISIQQVLSHSFFTMQAKGHRKNKSQLCQNKQKQV